MANRILSYVAALAEVCERDNIVSTYDLVRVEGPCHDPVFVMRGVAGTFQAEGSGQKKQTAKQHAAKQILLAMGELSAEDLRVAESSAGFETAKVIGNVVDDGPNYPFRSGFGSIPIEEGKEKRRNAYTPVPMSNQLNPLGDLIEMSALMGWPHPRVVDEQRTGPPHDPRFTVSCYFSKFKTFATSRNKKEAKRLAAFEMHESMRYQPDIMYKYSMRSGRPMDYSAVYADGIEPLDSEPFARPSDFSYGDVPKILFIAESHTVEMLKKLKSVDEIANPEVFLQNIVKECRFEVHFEVLGEDLVCRPAGTDAPGHPLLLPYVPMPYVHVPYVHVPYVHVPYVHVPYVQDRKLSVEGDKGDEGDEKDEEDEDVLCPEIQKQESESVAATRKNENITENEDTNDVKNDVKSDVKNENSDCIKNGARNGLVFYTVFCVLRLPIRTPIRLIGYGASLDDARYAAAKNALNYVRLMSLKDS